jgi:restriction system protein
MKKYIRLMLGAKSAHIEECLKGNLIGADFGIYQDLSPFLYENWRDFNKKFIPNRYQVRFKLFKT